jgi:hypothetical protein
MAVTVESDANGKHYRIMLDKTGADTGTVDLTTWQHGQIPTRILAPKKPTTSIMPRQRTMAQSWCARLRSLSFQPPLP